MKLEIKNIELTQVLHFLDSIEVGGLKGIHRTNLALKLQEQLKYVMDSEQQIDKDYKGNKEKIKEDLIALHEEKAVIDTGDSRAMLESVKNTVKEVANDEKQEFKGEEAYGLTILYNAFGLDAE